MLSGTTKFLGICVGGPLAGQFVIKDRPNFTAAQTLDPPPFSNNAEDVYKEIAVSHFSYYHRTIGITQDGMSTSWDFFVPHNYRISDIMDTLVENYCKYHDLKN